MAMTTILPSSSSFSLLRLRLPGGHHQDVAIVCHRTPAAHSAVTRGAFLNAVQQPPPYLALHLGAGYRSWRSDRAANPDTCIYSHSADIVQGRPCGGPLQKFACPPTWPQAPTQTPREWRRQIARLLLQLLIIMLVFLMMIQVTIKVAVWCNPTMNPGGMCQAALHGMIDSFNHFQHSSSTSSIELFSPTAPSKLLQPLPSSSVSADSPTHAALVVVDPVKSLVTLLANYRDQIHNSKGILFRQLRPFLVHIISETTTLGTGGTNLPHLRAPGNLNHTSSGQLEGRQGQDLVRLTELQALLSDLETLLSTQSRADRQLMKHLQTFSASWTAGRELSGRQFAWSPTGGRPWLIKQPNQENVLAKTIASRNKRLFARFTANIGCPARRPGDHEGEEGVLTVLQTIARAFDSVTDSMDGLQPPFERISREQGIALKELLQQGSREARIGAAVARKALVDLQNICSNLHVCSESGWKLQVGGETEFSSYRKDGVRELWITWPSDNDAIDALATFRLA